jgi:hypothetical protein
MNTNPLTTVGLMLTLASLVGSFFYIQLSQWLRDLLALGQKVELNKRQGDEAQKRAIVECRVDYRRLANWYTYAVNLVVIGFVIFVVVIGLLMIGHATGDPMEPYIRTALIVFLILFVVLACGLLAVGFSNARAVKKQLPS